VVGEVRQLGQGEVGACREVGAEERVGGQERSGRVEAME